MTSALLFAALVLLPDNTRVELGARTEGRAGVLRDPDSEDTSGGFALQLIPAALVELREGDIHLRGSYALNLGVQGSFGGFGTYSSHSVNGSFLVGEENAGIRSFGSVAAFFGDVDFLNAAQSLQQPFGLGGEKGIIPVLFIGGTLGASSRPVTRLRLQTSASVQVAAVPEPVPETRDLVSARPPPTTVAVVDPLQHRFLDGRIARGLPVQPLPDVLVPQLLPEVVASGQYTLTPRDIVEVEARFATALKLEGPTYGAATPSLRYSRRLTAAWSSDARLGLLFGWRINRLGTLRGDGTIWPLIDVGVSGQTHPSVLGLARWSARAGMVPYYDPFIGALTQRLIVGASTQWLISHDVSIDAGVQSYSLLGLLGTSVQARRIPNDHIVALSSSASWFFLRALKLEGGVIGSLRAKNPVVPVGRYVSPEIVAYVALAGGFPVVEEKETRAR